MNMTIEKFRDRRMKRLLTRMDASEIQWISTDRGNHIPLVDGKSVGGWSKGKTFSKVSKSTTKRNPTPSQKLSSKLRSICREENSTERNKKMVEEMLNADKGAKIFFEVDGEVFGFEKITEPSKTEAAGTWQRILGSSTGKTPFPGLDETDRANSKAIAAHASTADKFYSNQRSAKSAMNKKFPYTGEYGKRVTMTKGSDGKDLAMYEKSVNGSKEVYEAAKRGEIMVPFKFKAFLEKQSVGKPESVRIEYDEQDPRKAVAIAVFKDSNGKGKKKTTRELRYKMKISGKKTTYVTSEGKPEKRSNGKDNVVYTVDLSFEKEE